MRYRLRLRRLLEQIASTVAGITTATKQLTWVARGSRQSKIPIVSHAILLLFERAYQTRSILPGMESCIAASARGCWQSYEVSSPFGPLRTEGRPAFSMIAAVVRPVDRRCVSKLSRSPLSPKFEICLSRALSYIPVACLQPYACCLVTRPSDHLLHVMQGHIFYRRPVEVVRVAESPKDANFVAQGR